MPVWADCANPILSEWWGFFQSSFLSPIIWQQMWRTGVMLKEYLALFYVNTQGISQEHNCSSLTKRRVALKPDSNLHTTLQYSLNTNNFHLSIPSHICWLRCLFYERTEYSFPLNFHNQHIVTSGREESSFLSGNET